MILTDDATVSEKCKYYRNLCFSEKRRFVHEELGWNYRMTNLQAALGLAQLEQIDLFIQKRRHMGKLYSELLKDIPGLQFPLTSTDYADNIYWFYGIVVQPNSKKTSEDIVKGLSQKNIGTRPFFWCMHEQPVFQKKGWYKNESYPNSEYIARNGFYIPSGLGLSDDEIYRVAESIKDIMS
jgi:perosamine synthetase